MSSKKKPVKLVTPIGQAVYPKLTEPDTAFNEAGEYKCLLRVEEDDYKAFRLQIDPLIEAAYTAECEKQGKEVRKFSSEPVRIADDGAFEINTKQRAKVVTRSGDTLDFSVALVDSKGSPIKDKPKIGSGSQIRCAVTFNPWFVPSQGWGYTLRLREAQIVKLVEYNVSANSSFGVVDGGYEATGGEGFGEVLESDDEGTKVAPF